MSHELESATAAHSFDLASLCRYFSERSPLPEVAVEGTTHIVRYVNLAFARLVGKGQSELIGLPFSEVVPEGERNRCPALLDRVYRTGMPENLVEQKHRQERPTYWSYAIWAVLGPDECPAGVMIQVTDATESAVFRKQVTGMNETLLLSSIRQHELTEMANNLNARLQTAIQHKDHFMAVLSHELRTPLTPILAAVWLLRRDKRLDDVSFEHLEMIERNVTLEARLIDDLLDMTRIGRGLMNLKRFPVDLCVVIGHSVEVCRPDLEAGKLTLEVDLKEGPLIGEADAGRLQQVFWNLLRNAIKFSPVGGHVRIRCRRRGDSSAVVEVSDDGIGIDSEFIPQIFDAFQQGDQDQVRKYGGLGLGLAISRTIVELHGGTITARSEGMGKGASFSVVLPLLTGVGSVSAGREPGGSGPLHSIRRMRILLVEDHVDSSRMMRRLLAIDGHAVKWAPDVATGLKLAGEQPFDLLISDLGLPDGSGLDLMHALRRQGSTLPGIALSGYGQDQDITRSVEAGFARHLTKPVNFDDLHATIQTVAQDHQGR